MVLSACSQLVILPATDRGFKALGFPASCDCHPLIPAFKGQVELVSVTRLTSNEALITYCSLTTLKHWLRLKKCKKNVFGCRSNRNLNLLAGCRHPAPAGWESEQLVGGTVIVHWSSPGRSTADLI